MTFRSVDDGGSKGVYRQSDGTWLAMTYTRSKTFKTELGARRWYAKATGEPSRTKHRSKGKHHAGGRTAKEQALRNVEAAGIRYVRAGMPQPNPDRGYERALTAAWKAGATGTDIQMAMARGEARAGRHRARGRHR